MQLRIRILIHVRILIQIRLRIQIRIRIEVLLHGRWHNSQKVELIQAGESIQEDFPFEGNGYIPQIEEVNRCILAEKTESELWSHQDALELGLMVEEVFEKIKGEAD